MSSEIGLKGDLAEHRIQTLAWLTAIVS